VAGHRSCGCRQPDRVLGHGHHSTLHQRRPIGSSAARTYIGPWLPEPVDTSADPTVGAERGEALELAVLLLLEKLTPTERAAYILRESFAYSYAEIATILQLGQANTRQIVTGPADTSLPSAASQ